MDRQMGLDNQLRTRACRRATRPPPKGAERVSVTSHRRGVSTRSAHGGRRRHWRLCDRAANVPMQGLRHESASRRTFRGFRLQSGVAFVSRWCRAWPDPPTAITRGRPRRACCIRSCAIISRRSARRRRACGVKLPHFYANGMSCTPAPGLIAGRYPERRCRRASAGSG